MCESLVSTGNLSAGENRVEETDITNDVTAHVHPPMLPGASSSETTVGFSNRRIEDIVNPHHQVHNSCSQCIDGDCYPVLLEHNQRSHRQHQCNNKDGHNLYPLLQIHSSCSNCSDSDGDSCHSLLNQSPMLVICDRETNNSSKRRGCFTSTILKSPYFVCVALLCVVTLVILGVSLRNNNTVSYSKDLLTQIDFINKTNNVSTSITSSPKQVDITSDTQSTTVEQEYTTATTLSVSPVIDLLNAVEEMQKLLPCEPRIVKLGLKNAINDPTNSILDKHLYPQVIAIKRCDNGDSYCGDDYGESDLGKNSKKCISVKNRTIPIKAWDRVEPNKFIPIGPIHIIEDIKCQCK